MKQGDQLWIYFCFLKNLIGGKSKQSVAQFQYNLKALNMGYKKNKLSKTLYYASRDMLNLEFLNSENSFSATFCA